MESEQKTFKLPHVPYEAIIDIKVSGLYLKRCQGLLLSIGEQMGREKFQEVLKKFSSTPDNPSDITEATVYILTALVAEAEKCAIEQKLVKELEITAEEAAKIGLKVG